jgi:hypothetical protein
MARNSPKIKNAASNPEIIMVELTPITLSDSNPGAILFPPIHVRVAGSFAFSEYDSQGWLPRERSHFYMRFRAGERVMPGHDIFYRCGPGRETCSVRL